MTRNGREVAPNTNPQRMPRLPRICGTAYLMGW